MRVIFVNLTPLAPTPLSHHLGSNNPIHPLLGENIPLSLSLFLVLSFSLSLVLSYSPSSSLTLSFLSLSLSPLTQSSIYPLRRIPFFASYPPHSPLIPLPSPFQPHTVDSPTQAQRVAVTEARSIDGGVRRRPLLYFLTPPQLLDIVSLRTHPPPSFLKPLFHLSPPLPPLIPPYTNTITTTRIRRFSSTLHPTFTESLKPPSLPFLLLLLPPYPLLPSPSPLFPSIVQRTTRGRNTNAHEFLLLLFALLFYVPLNDQLSHSSTF